MPTRQIEVTTWYLEQLSSDELRPARAPEVQFDIVRAEIPSPELSRYLYTAVGGDWYWTDRLGWSHDQWRNWLSRPGVETWVAYVRGTPAGYVELDPQPDGHVEITCFGLVRPFIGQGIGGRLLTVGTSRAWDLADRWDDRKPTERVWLNTCSNDGPSALRNYQARGFRVYDVTVATGTFGHNPPGPWPGAR
ncbi:GNAT family N-acetyltransferase [Actinomadura rubrisoli]|uniref:GNAT family N-acetyltransferase n=1 Tax=Actinomadura rubrisoli TaxID=2530368 RepID=A0A4R5AIM6_9ACTN|nr:GNAT family N-acetyltransferase [Actinomadura rubrisoli]TDD69982.1 GNAT family N-acetyltransferase [Actinomadura rubrisoli]